MRVTVDNLDGLGAIDYSDRVMAEGPVTIDRRLNAPSTCRWALCDGVTRPARLGRVVVTSAAGAVLFTGYLPREAEAVYAGEGSHGPVYRLELEATSDEWLLDKQGLRVAGESFATGGDALLASLTSRVDGSRFTSASTGQIAQVGRVDASHAQRWSEMAAALANAAGASYQVMSGQVAMAPLGSVVHALAVADDSLSESGLRLAAKRELANDVTVSGAIEAGSYLTEIFVGDGTTSDFALSAVPFGGGSVASRMLVRDNFSAGAIDRQQWGGGDPGSHLSVGAGGLVLSGGNGLDGQTTLLATSGVELGGVLRLEATAVALTQGSDGVLLGLYSGTVSRTNCVAGFNVKQVNGATTVGCLVNGAAVGTTATLATGHLYTLRLYLHAAETQRVRQRYVVLAGGVAQQFGGGLVDAPLDVVFAIEDMGVSSNTPMTVLYDGSMGSSPASVSFAPVNSVQLIGTIGSIVAEQMPPVWVRGMTSAGAAVTRLSGGTGTGADYVLASAGTLRYFAGRVPAAGEQVIVRYRTGQRAAARVQATASVLSEGAGGLPGVAAWQGSVLEPVAGSSEDCAAAATALLALATSRAEATSGSYDATGLTQVWPGDVMQFVTSGGTSLVTVRGVRLRDAGAVPELVHTHLEVANDWAECASLRVSETLAADTGGVPVGGGASSVAGLSGLQVVSISKTALQLDAGGVAPSGGGFEVRRSEGGFGPGQGGGLVLRSSVRGMTVPRGAQVERFYVRMFDGSTPPVYSRLSSVVVTNVPVG